MYLSKTSQSAKRLSTDWKARKDPARAPGCLTRGGIARSAEAARRRLGRRFRWRPTDRYTSSFPRHRATDQERSLASPATCMTTLT